MKRIVLILLALSLFAFAGCGDNGKDNKGGNPNYEVEEDEGKNTGDKTGVYADAPYIADEYAANPCVGAAQKLSDKVVRVLFTSHVRPASTGIWKRVTVGGNAAVSMKMCDLRLDETENKSATVYEFTFENTVPDGAEIKFSGAEGDVGRALVTLLCGGNGEGLYAPNGTSEAPYASVEIGKDEIAVPNPPTQLVAAYYESENSLMIEFSKPVRCLKDWITICYVSDCGNPEPGYGDSWQLNVSSVKPLDTVKGGDGKSYASVYRVKIDASKSQMKNFYENSTVVFRISENDDQAAAESRSTSNNRDIGRVVTAIDGTPVEANFYLAWDVAYVTVTRDLVFPIEINN